MSDDTPHPHPWDSSDEIENKKHRLLFEPEPLDRCRARFAAALMDRYDAVTEYKRPYNFRRHPTAFVTWQSAYNERRGRE